MTASRHSLHTAQKEAVHEAEALDRRHERLSLRTEEHARTGVLSVTCRKKQKPAISREAFTVCGIRGHHIPSMRLIRSDQLLSSDM